MTADNVQSRNVRDLLKPALVLALPLLVPLAPLYAQWQAATAVPGAPATTKADPPSVAIAADQSVAIAWRQHPYDIWVALRQGPAGAWTTERISEATTLTQPQIAMNEDGDLIVAWTGFGHVLARYRPAGGPWEAVKTLEIHSSGWVRGDVRAAINEQGDVLVGWTTYDGPPVTRLEVRTMQRSRSGPWPATGTAEIAGFPASDWGDLDVALDDAGWSAAAWTMPYAAFEGGTDSVYVLRGATRPPGGAWGEAIDLSERGAAAGTIPCEEGHPAMPDARGPRLEAGATPGQLAVAYLFNPTAVEWSGVPDPGPGCYETEDGVVHYAQGTFAAPPTDWLSIGSNVIGMSAPVLGVRGGHWGLGWLEDAAEGNEQAHYARFGVDAAGQAIAPSLDHYLGGDTIGGVQSAIAFDAAGDGRGLFAASESSTDVATGWSSLAGGGDPEGPVGMGGDVEISPGVRTLDLASTCEGYGVAVWAATDRQIYLAEYAPGRPACRIFKDGFESGDSDRWSTP